MRQCDRALAGLGERITQRVICQSATDGEARQAISASITALSIIRAVVPRGRAAIDVDQDVSGPIFGESVARQARSCNTRRRKEHELASDVYGPHSEDCPVGAKKSLSLLDLREDGLLHGITSIGDLSAKNATRGLALGGLPVALVRAVVAEPLGVRFKYGLQVRFHRRVAPSQPIDPGSTKPIVPADPLPEALEFLLVDGEDRTQGARCGILPQVVARGFRKLHELPIKSRYIHVILPDAPSVDPSNSLIILTQYGVPGKSKLVLRNP
jgi:hypothetical protein